MLSVVGREFKETKTCGHVMTKKGTPLKTSTFFSIFLKEAATYFLITAYSIQP